jgi:hypothetical protein
VNGTDTITGHMHQRHPEVLAVLHGEPRRIGHKCPRPSFETRVKGALLRMTANLENA